jgi:non-specific protein-tyrosine kinase
MEITYYLRLFQRWAWLLIIAGIVGGSLAYINEISKVPSYTAVATISIGNYIESPNPDGYDIQVGRFLADTYVHLVTTYDVLSGAAVALNNGLSADSLSGKVRAAIIDSTSLLQISARSDDPVLAVDIANAVAEQLVVQSPSNLTPDQEAQISFAQEQITNLNSQIESSRQRLEELDRQIAVTTEQSDLTQLQRTRDSVVNQINQASSTIAQFTDTVITLQRRVNAVDIVEAARFASISNTSNPVFGTFVGIVIGVMLAAGIVLVIDYLDDTIHTSEEAAQTLSLPVLGAIIKFGNRKATYNERLMTNIPPMSAPSEAYRTLRTNVLFGAEQHDSTPVYVVTSVGPEEGKSLTAANLAVTMAQAGLHVLLVDADLRRPKVHEIFGLENKVGLTTLLFVDPGNVGNGNGTEDTTSVNLQSPDLRQCLQNTAVTNLRVITSGFLPSNPAEILGSALMNRWMMAFRQASNVNVIVVDTPPGLMVADSSVLAASVGAEAIFVLDAGRTRRRAALKLKEQFAGLGIPIKGVVVNRVRQRDEADLFGYGYKYGYYYVNADGTGVKPTGIRRFLPSRR